MRQVSSFSRKIYRVFLYTLAVVVVTSAVMLSVARILFPELTGYREQIELELGKYLEHKVHIDSMDARLVGLTPTLIFHNVHMFDDKKEIISFKEARLGIALLESIKQRNIVPLNFTIVGTVISINQSAAGRFSVQGVDVTDLQQGKDKTTATNEDLAGWLFKRSSISLQNSTIIWKQKNKNDQVRQFDKVNVTIRNEDNRHQLTGSLDLPSELGHKLELALDLHGDLLNPAQWKGVFHLKGKAVKIAELDILPEVKGMRVVSGITDCAVWGKWENGRISDLSGDVALYGFGLKKKKQKDITYVDILKGQLAWQGNSDNWSFGVSNLSYTTDGVHRPKIAIMARHNTSDVDQSTMLDVSLDYIRLDDLRKTILYTGLLDKKQARMLNKLSPAGEVRNLRVYAKSLKKELKHFEVTAVADKVDLAAWQEIPGVSGLSGNIKLTEQRGYFDLQSNAFKIDAPQILRSPLSLQHAKGIIKWENLAGNWQINTSGLELKNQDLDSRLDATITTSNAKHPVHLDIRVGVKDMDAKKVSNYLPIGIMPKNLVNWLDQLFIDGQLTQAGFAIHGDYQPLPFRRGKGNLQAYVQGKGMQLSLHDDWPQFSESDIGIVITDRGLDISNASGKLYNSDARQVNATIRNFSRPSVEVSGRVLGSLADAGEFLTNTPIAPGAKPFASKTKLLGDIETDVTLRIPLNDKTAKRQPFRFSGFTKFQDNHVYMSNNTLDVTNINGTVKFSDKSISSKWLKANIFGNKGKLKVRSSKPEGRFVISVDSKGRNSGANLYKRFPLPGVQRVKGRVPWKSSITLAHNSKGIAIPTRIRVKTNLAGVLIDLPEPFRKTRENNRNVTFDMLFTGPNKTESITQYGDRVAAHLEMDNSYTPARILRGELHLAAGKASLPKQNRLLVTGVLNDLAYSEWTKVIEEHVAVHKKKDKEPILHIPVIFDMGYLSIPFHKKTDKSSSKKRKAISPRLLPAMSGKIDRFFMDGVDLGMFKFSSHKDQHGLVFDKLELEATPFIMQGKGKWQYRRGDHITDFKAEMMTHNLGKMLRAFGFKAIIENGLARSNFDFRWEGAPYGFRFASLDGKMRFTIDDGNIIKVDPGAGRLLGLLSLTALPRRLLLDFRDMSEGMSFDKMTGTFAIRQGDAVTRDLKVEGPLADITITGRTGLHARDFDQTVIVTPQASGTLPVVGGLLGGTQVGAIVLLFERIFGSDVDKSLSSKYRITGTWDKPLIKRLDKPKSAEDDTATVEQAFDEAA